MAGKVRVVKLPAGKGEYAAAILFPIKTRCDSGVAHVLEHVLSCSKNKYGRSLRDLRDDFADVSINALTECDRIVFFATCATVESFIAAVACLLELPSIQIESALVQQEGFQQLALETDNGSRFVASGVVYNEMKSTFYTESRQLLLGTSEQLFDGSFGHDSGGDPEILCHVTPAQVDLFATEFITHANAFLLVQGGKEALAEAERLSRDQVTPPRKATARSSRLRRRMDSGTHLYDGNEGVYFHRYALPIGKALDPTATFVSWVIDGALKEFSPALVQVGARVGGEYLSRFSGTLQTGPDLHLLITFRARVPEIDHRQLLNVVIKQYLVDYVHARPPIKHTIDREIQLRERHLAYERGTPSGLLMLCDHLLYGGIEEFNRLPDDVERVRQILSHPSALREALTAAFSANWRRIVVPPSSRAFCEVMSRENRMLNRLSIRRNGHFAPPRLADIASEASAPLPFRARPQQADVAKPAGILNTGGIAYLHLVFNLSQVDADLLPFVPLAAHVIVETADTLGAVSLQCSPFSQWTSATDASIFLAVRMKWIRGAAPKLDESNPKEYLFELLEAATQRVTLRKEDVDSFATGLMRNPMGVLFAQTGSAASMAAHVTGLWSGFSQVRFLEAPHPTDLLSEPVFRLIRQLAQCPMMSFLFDDGTESAEALARVSALAAEPGWRSHRHSQGFEVQRSNAISVVAGIKGLPSILLKYSIGDLDSAKTAALCLALEVLDSALFTPVLRDSLGSYGVFFGRDQTLNQLFIGVYQTPSLLECSRQFARLGNIVDRMALDRLNVASLRIKAQMKFGLAESALNRLVIASYDHCLGRVNREREIIRCVRTIPLGQAMSEASAFFGARQPSMSATCSTTTDLRAELGLDRVEAVVLQQR